MTNNPHRAYQAYLEARYARFSTPEALVFRMVRTATGTRPVASARILKGNDNEVYVVTTAQRQEFVTRIHRAGESGLQDEAWALAAVRAVGVPVPDVLLVDRLVDKEQSLEYMVQTKVPGRSLAELQRALTPQEWEHVLLQMGGMLARVHTVRTGGFYKRQREDVWDFPTRSGLMTSVAQDRAARWLRGQG